ncbi:MAG: BatD family protein [Bacteroidales bacterium]|jgi:hypothetical protein|nr:BatD family protein [Bacteroidales bacterium]
MVKKSLLSVLFIFFALTLHAEEVKVTVNCPRVVKVGEPFQLDVEINGKGSQPAFAEMTAFKVLRSMGTQQQVQTSMSGGKFVSSVIVVYSYAVQAMQEGTQDFPAVEVTVDKKKYQSSPVPVQVVAGNASAQAQAQQGGATAQPDNSQVQTDNREVFVSVIPSRSKMYQGEYITATLKLFSKVDISSINDVKFPTFDGFFKQDLDTPPLRSLERETVNGEVYGAGVLKQIILFPQKSGTLTISPCSMEIGIAQRVQTRSHSIFDGFFGGTQVQTVPREVKSYPVNITVLPLPEGKPASFSNAVGQLKLNVSVDKTEVKANDPITLKVVISGTGNIKFADAPKVNFPPDFEAFDPKVNTNLNTTATSGSKTFEYVIVPRHGGVYKLPAIEFSFFDPQAKQYKSLHSEEYTITVEKGEEQPGSTAISGITREDVKFIGKDVRYIKQNYDSLHKKGDYFFGTWKFLLWFIVPLLGFATIVYFRRKYIRKYSDLAFVKNKHANRYASKRLKKASTFMNSGQQTLMYEELSRALWGYLSDKLNIPVADLSKDAGKQTMQQNKVPESLIDEFIGVIDDCEFARYAPSSGNADMKTLYNRAVDVIDKMQRTI